MRVESVSPRVSVIIPTYGRPHLVGRAVHSALAQTVEDIEVIVVLDGPDEAASAELERLADSRLRLETVPERRGQAAATNIGVRRARARWVALLDDDDEWMPRKLECQLRTAESSAHSQPIVGCRLIARREEGDLVWPRRLPDADEPLSEYLFCRRSLFFGEGLLQTSVILAPTELMRCEPFGESLVRHSDLDWLLRSAARSEVGLHFVPESDPLAIWHMERGHARASGRPDWRFSLGWIRGMRHLVTARAYAGFLLTWISANARQTGDLRAFGMLAYEACRRGSPNPTELLTHLGIWLVPWEVRERLSSTVTRNACACHPLPGSAPDRGAGP